MNPKYQTLPICVLQTNLPRNSTINNLNIKTKTIPLTISWTCRVSFGILHLDGGELLLQVLDSHGLHPGALLVEVEQVPSSFYLCPTFLWWGHHVQLPHGLELLHEE